jgi:hypothetical protein
MQHEKLLSELSNSAIRRGAERGSTGRSETLRNGTLRCATQKSFRMNLISCSQPLFNRVKAKLLPFDVYYFEAAFRSTIRGSKPPDSDQ